MNPEVNELRKIIEADVYLDTIPKSDIRILGYCPEESYISYLFVYKNTCVLLDDKGNQHFSFNREVPDIKKLYIESISQASECNLKKYYESLLPDDGIYLSEATNTKTGLHPTMIVEGG